MQLTGQPQSPESSGDTVPGLAVSEPPSGKLLTATFWQGQPDTASCCSWLRARPEGLSQCGTSSCGAWAPGASGYPGLMPEHCTRLPRAGDRASGPLGVGPSLVTDVLWDVGQIPTPS